MSKKWIAIALAFVCVWGSLVFVWAEDETAPAEALSDVAETTAAPVETTTEQPATEPTTEQKTETTTLPPTEPTAAPTTEPPGLEGDVDGNGRVTAADARLILRASARLIELNVPLSLVDVDKNGRLSAADARIVLRRSARLPDKESPTSQKPATTTKPVVTTKPTTQPTTAVQYPVTLAYPTNDAEWELILLNTNYRVGNVDKKLKLAYVANSTERMDYRAAAAYTKMYGAAARAGLYLTPCSGYRSYDAQVYLFEEFVQEYLAQGYGRKDAEKLASRRRMPAGSSEHNIGICMDIICAGSAYNFQYTKEYMWLLANAADYGFILRYPPNKTAITGVKFEPWHWRYVGVANARKIKASGLCLEEYLGKA